MAPEKASTAASGKTTSTQAKKEQERFAEEILHPRWIAVKSDYNPWAKPLSQVQKIVQEALDKNSKSIQQQSDYESIVGEELFASIDEGQREFIQSWMKHLKRCHASEAQWESIIWRPWFLRGDLQLPPGDKRPDSKPFIGRIVQAKMTLSEGGAALPPLLASSEARRKSGLIVPVPWVPDLKRQTRCCQGVRDSATRNRRTARPVVSR